MSADVMCIGIACADVLIRGCDFAAPWVAESKSAEETSVHVGGDAANQAIVLSHMGVKVKAVLGIGGDGVGQFIQSAFQEAGVDVGSLIVGKGERSALNIICIHPDGQRNFINSGMPKSVFFEPALEEIRDVKVVSLGSLMMPPFLTVESVDRVVRRAKEIGAVVCADVIYNPNSCSIDELGKNGTLQYIDYIFPNEEEARLLTGKEDLREIADVFLGYGVKNVLIKIGARGVYIKNQNGEMIVPAVGRVVVDTTGAGDNFAAGFITGLVEGKSLKDCAYLAAATAGVAIQSIGANTGVKSRQQVQAHLEANTQKEGTLYMDNIKGLAHIGFFVRDTAVSKAFYSRVLGFECVFERTEPGPNGSTVTISFLQNGSAMFEMICVPGLDFPKDGCFQHVAFAVENIEEAQQKLEAAGIRTDPLVHSKETFKNGAKWVTFLGPDGEHLEITEIL